VVNSALEEVPEERDDEIACTLVLGCRQARHIARHRGKILRILRENRTERGAHARVAGEAGEALRGGRALVVAVRFEPVDEPRELDRLEHLVRVGESERPRLDTFLKPRRCDAAVPRIEKVVLVVVLVVVVIGVRSRRRRQRRTTRDSLHFYHRLLQHRGGRSARWRREDLCIAHRCGAPLKQQAALSEGDDEALVDRVED